jgi:hypothetical protein
VDSHGVREVLTGGAGALKRPLLPARFGGGIAAFSRARDSTYSCLTRSADAVSSSRPMPLSSASVVSPLAVRDDEAALMTTGVEAVVARRNCGPCSARMRASSSICISSAMAAASDSPESAARSCEPNMPSSST